MDKPFFSICIPAYNRAEFLPALLESIISQDNTSYEVIIAEDVSPERLTISEIVNSYRQRLDIKFILNDCNLGYDKNLQNLIANAEGIYILFMGNDDLLAYNALSCAHSALIANPNVLAAGL